MYKKYKYIYLEGICQVYSTLHVPEGLPCDGVFFNFILDIECTIKSAKLELHEPVLDLRPQLP